MNGIGATTQQPEASEDAGAAGLELWRRAMRWRRALELELQSVGLTFAEWRILKSTAELVEEFGEPVSQSDVAERAEADRTTTSRVMYVLDERGWVNRGRAQDRHVNRIQVTPEGLLVIQRAKAIVSDMSHRFFAQESCRG